jgi:hypothetical protein
MSNTEIIKRLDHRIDEELVLDRYKWLHPHIVFRLQCHWIIMVCSMILCRNPAVFPVCLMAVHRCCLCGLLPFVSQK